MNAIGEDFALNNITISASLAFKDAALEVPEQLQELKVKTQLHYAFFTVNNFNSIQMHRNNSTFCVCIEPFATI